MSRTDTKFMAMFRRAIPKQPGILEEGAFGSTPVSGPSVLSLMALGPDLPANKPARENVWVGTFLVESDGHPAMDLNRVRMRCLPRVLGTSLLER
jgi:hypothetical protein